MLSEGAVTGNARVAFLFARPPRTTVEAVMDQKWRHLRRCCCCRCLPCYRYLVGRHCCALVGDAAIVVQKSADEDWVGLVATTTGVGFWWPCAPRVCFVRKGKWMDWWTIDRCSNWSWCWIAALVDDAFVGMAKERVGGEGEK